jgi:hypothetical protein
VREWWSGRYPTCAHHLFEALGADLHRPDLQRVGRGAVRVVRAHPASFTRSAAAAAELRLAARELAGALGHRWVASNRLVVRRGPYLIGAVLTESEGGSWSIEGRYIDLLDPSLPLVRAREVRPGEVVWLRDLDYEPGSPALLASASRIRDWSMGSATVSFASESASGVEVRTALRLQGPPRRVLLDGEPTSDCRYDAPERLLWLCHPGNPAGTTVRIELQV